MSQCLALDYHAQIGRVAPNYLELPTSHQRFKRVFFTGLALYRSVKKESARFSQIMP